jgi:glycosyltransferase involved in cell wall biosynthesis
MRILLVGNYKADGFKSMRRYGIWLERALRERGHQVTLVQPIPFFSRLGRSQGMKKYLAYLDKFMIFLPRLRWMTQKHDIAHVLDHSNSMYLSAVKRMPNLITCHDLIAILAARGEMPQSPPIGWLGKLFQRWILSGLCSARHVLCVSDKTASDLKALTGHPGGAGSELRVIRSPLNWRYMPSGALPGGLVFRLGLKARESYILQVGGNGWYKNRDGCLRIFSHLANEESFLAVRLIMVGDPWTSAMRSIVREERLGERVIEAVNVTNEELQALYSNALALLFPSFEEGFGWPILEAQACGCPVITSGRPPMMEVAGEAAIFIDPTAPQAAALIIAEGLKRRDDLREAGFRNLQRFDEKTIVDEYCAFYEEILEEKSSASQ